MKFRLPIFLTILGSFVPTVSFAAGEASPTISGLVSSFTNSVVTAIVSLFAAVGIAAFFFGIVRYIWGVRGGESKKIEEGNKVIIWSMIALFILFSIWGIITYTQGIFGVDSNSAIVIPNRGFQ